MDNVAAPPKRQKAITPKFLRYLCRQGTSKDPSKITSDAHDHAIDLIVGGFFFATRPCEIVKTPEPGKTKTLRIRNLTFRDRHQTVVRSNHPRLYSIAEFVTVTFDDQKNGQKSDSRTHRRTDDVWLCPVRRLARAVMRVLRHFPGADCDHLLCSTFDPKLCTTSLLTSNFTLTFLRNTCQHYGAKDTFGFGPSEIGNRSLRSGAAMALFLMNHSTAKIMILGRWSSDAFLVYIRPQVLEWTNCMSQDMISFTSFLDVGFYDVASKTDPRTRSRLLPLNGGGAMQIPGFNLHG